jgi:hypothetical protein
MKKYTKYLFLASLILLVAAGCNKTTTPADEATINANQNVNVNSNSNQNTTQQSTITYQGEEGKSALQILKEKYQTQTKEFTGMGEFVQSINGVVPDSSHFWAFYVNGVSSQVGASQYQTKATDNIEWKLDVINADSK